MYTMAMFSSRLSVCLFFRRLSASTQKTKLPDVLTCGCAILGMISVFVIGVRQRIMEPWSQDHSTVGIILLVKKMELRD